ncbi:MAG: AMP-binding protein [candidate division Zixibacteria bacterium]|nr:AMP-binding protein [candidate division Zixibacteria bacterium]
MNAQTTSWSAEKTISQTILRTAAKFPDRPALYEFGGKGKCWSFAEVSAKVRAISAGLKSLDIGPGDRVGILSVNRPEWAVSYLAALHSGATALPLDALLKPDELKNLIKAGAPRALILSGEFYKSIGESLSVIVPGITLITMDETVSAAISLESYYDMEPHEGTPVAGSHTAVLIFTSGTTGAPRAVELTHRNILSNLEGILAALKFTERDKFLSVLPLHHTFECTGGFLTPLAAGASVVYARSLAAPSLVEDLRTNGITVLVAVPLLFEKMARGIQRRLNSLDQPKRAIIKTFNLISSASRKVGLNTGTSLFRGLREKAGLGSLRMMVSGGAPLDPAIAEFFEILGFNFLEGYGMTECSPVISFNRPGRAVVGSVGEIIDGVDVRIDNPNPDGAGEIMVKGECVTPGYWNNKEATSALFRDGWLATGDLGMMRKGMLYICGRAKNLIISAGGKNIYPEEIEAKLLESEIVAEALVLGRDRKSGPGEEVHALIFPNFEEIGIEATGDDAIGDDTSEMARVKELISEVVKDVNAALGDYKRIVGWELVSEEFEKTSTRKIKRAKYK